MKVVTDYVRYMRLRNKLSQLSTKELIKLARSARDKSYSCNGVTHDRLKEVYDLCMGNLGLEWR